jgi:MFS family permease
MPRLADYPALRHRNFRLLWSGQCVSLVGTLMQNAAVLWQVALLAPAGNKAMALGFVGLARVVPILILALLGGVLADAFDRRKLMIATQSAMALTAVALAVWSLGGGHSLMPIYVLTAISAAAASIDAPARSSLVPMLVPRELVSNAVSLNTMLFQLASIIGPTAAGLSLVWLDVGWVYAINAVSFVPVLIALSVMRDVPQRQSSDRPRVSWQSAVDGVRFVFRTPLIRACMLLDFNAAFFSSAMALMPLFATDVLHVGPTGFGWLYAAPSIGAVAASAWLVKAESHMQRRGLVFLWAIAAYGAATVAFGLSTSFVVTLIALCIVGAADMVNMVVRNVIRQLHTPDVLRGRMTAVNVVFAQGGPQLGELEAGLVAQAAGPAASVVSGGIACLVVTAWIAWKTPIMRRYGASASPSMAPAPGQSAVAA